MQPKIPRRGELKGVAVDLGKDLARRVGVPFDPAVYPNPPALIGDANSGAWDVALIGINAERAAAMDFSAPCMEVELGYLVRAAVSIATASDVDKAGVRIGVLEKSGAGVYLSRTLKNAILVRVKSLPENYALLDDGKADVIAATKTAIFTEAASRPGSRVLDGRILVEPIGMGVPQGTQRRRCYVRRKVRRRGEGGGARQVRNRAGQVTRRRCRPATK